MRFSGQEIQTPEPFQEVSLTQNAIIFVARVQKVFQILGVLPEAASVYFCLCQVL